MQKLFKALLSLAIFALFLAPVNDAFGQCPPGTSPSSDIELVFNPPPNPDGTFDAGSTVEICATIDNYPGGGANWCHGFAFTFSPAWDVSSVVVINAPVAAGGAGGDWLWVAGGINPYGPGFYYDANTGGPQDGDPSNNFGDVGGAEFWEFCIEITLGPPPGDPGFCGGPGNPLNGTNIAPGLTNTGDGDTGSWGIPSDTPCNESEPITMNCCDAEPGVSPGTLPICENGTICLSTELIPPFDAAGVWTGPPGWVELGGPGCGQFDPTSDPAGDYTYTVFGTGGCFNSSIITMEFIDLGTLVTVAHCDPGPLDLCTTVFAPEGFPTDGQLYDPSGTPMASCLVDPFIDPPGNYLYEFVDASNCFTTVVQPVIFSTGGAAGCETWVDLCTEEPAFCMFDFLDCTPAPGGQWIVWDATSGAFLDYISLYDFCLTPSDYTDDIRLEYILGAAPCAPSLTEMHVTIFDLVNTGLATEASICVTDPPVNLEGLLDPGPTDPLTSGLTWTTLSSVPAGQPDATNPLDPSLYLPNTQLQLLYEGGLAGTPCENSTLLTLNILPADANAGLPNTIDICETDPFFEMITFLNENPALNPPEANSGGQWTTPTGALFGNFFTPGIDAPGTYTYTVISSCDADVSTLTINEFTLPDPGVDNASIVCETNGNVNLTALLGGTPTPGGAWTEQGTGNPVADPFNVTGQCGTTFNFTYTVTNGPCSNSADLSMNVECSPFAGADVIETHCGDGSILNLPTPPPGGGAGFWSPGSIITCIPANSGVYTYTTVGAVACAEDQAIYTINIIPEITVSAVTTTCEANQTEYITEWTISGGTPPYTVAGMSGGTMTSPTTFESNVITEGTPYNFTISDSGPCLDINVNGASPVCTCLATANFTSPNTTVCAGSCTNLIVTPSGGVAPYTIEYTDGINPPLTHIWNTAADVIPVCPTVTTTYSIVSVEDANCVGTAGFGTTTVSVETPPDAGPDVPLEYCGDGLFINLNTEIPGGITPGGIWVPGFNIQKLPANSGIYTYTLIGGGNCPADVAQYIVNIDPEITTTIPVTSCTPDQTEYIVTFDILTGVQGYSVTNGTMITATSFESNPIPAGAPFNFTVSDNGNCGDLFVNGISPVCVCTATAELTSGNVTICEGSCTNLEFTMTNGVVPFTVEYSDGPNTFIEIFNSTVVLFPVCPATTTTYSIVSVSDANCVGTGIGGSVTVSVEPQPYAGPDVVLNPYCGDGSFLNLDNVLDPTADFGGIWTPPFNGQLIPSNSGTYTYTVSGAVCPSDAANYTLNIEEVLSTSNLLVACEANQTEYSVVFDVAGGDGTYSVLDSYPGNTGSWSGSTYSSDPIPAGTAYSFTVSSTGLCPDIVVSGISPNCSCAATSTILSPNTTICEGSCFNIEIENFGAPSFDVVYHDGTNDILLPGIGSNYLLQVCPLVTTTYTLVSVEDANCVGSAFGSVTITVEEQKDAGPDVVLPTFCGDNSIINLFSELDPAADTPGSFDPPPGNFIAIPSNAGVYTYTVTGTVCPDDQADYTVNIDAELAASNINASCMPNQTDYIVTFDISGGTGPGTYSVDPLDGSIAGNIFTSTVQTVGNAFSFTISDLGPCADLIVSGISPNCNCAATSSFTSTNTTICAGSCTDLIIDNVGNPPFTIVYNDGTDHTSLTSDLSYTLTVCPLTPTTYSLVSVTDADCMGNAFGSVTVSVDSQMNAGSDAILVFCEDELPINLYNYLESDADGSGTFDNANPIISGVYTYTVGGNTCPDDLAFYTVTFDEVISVGSIIGACDPNQTQYSVQFENTGNVMFTVTTGPPGSIVPQNVNPGVTFDSGLIDFATNPNYSFTLSDASACGDIVVSDIAPDCNCIAQGSLSGSTTICAGDCAEIELVAIGDGPFDITYEDSCNPGAPTTITVPNGYIFTVCPITDCTYTLTAISDQYCDGVVTGTPVTVNVDSQLQVNSVNEVIDVNNENYQVVIALSGGDPLTYNFSPAGGVYESISGTYTSAPIICGNGYSITIGDGGVCPSVIVDSPSFDCGCVSFSGTIVTNPENVCIDGTISAIHFGDETMDGNDILEFILHDGLGGTIGNVLGRTYDGVFDMNSYSVVADEPYCIVAVVGTADFSGHVILGDDCTSVSDCLPITIKALPTASISGGAAVCPGECVNIIFEFTGTAPWNYAYSHNGGPDITGVANTNTELISICLPGDYTLVSVVDQFCTGTVSGLANIQNYTTPTATMGGDPDVCVDSGDGPVINFTGQPPYTFNYTISGSPEILVENITSNIYTLPATVSGMYVITTLTDNNCDGTVSGNLNVEMIDLPTATITGGGTVCDGDELPFIVTFTGTSPWNATYSVGGIGQSPIVDNYDSVYTFDSGVDGVYELTLVSDLKCSGDIIPSNAELIVNPLPTAELEASTTAFCIGEEIELGIILNGVPPFDVTYVLNNDTTTITGLLASTSQILTPDGPVNAEILYVEDGSNPTCASTPFSAVYIDAGTLANAPVLEDDSLCASNGPIRIGVTSAPGLTYQWIPEDQLDDPTASNPLFSPTGSNGPIAQTLTYVLVATDGSCSAADTMTIKVDPGPTARFAYSPDPVKTEDTEVFFNNYTIGSDAVVYYWEFDTLGTSQQENPTFKFPDGINDSYDITLTAIDAVTGCMDVTTDVLTVQPEMLMYIPNAFTPDGDGLNDLWGPVMQNVDPDNYHITVFDRFGGLIFESSTLGQKWNGSVNGGDHYVKAGVYIWMIETKNSITLEEVEFKGTVTVVR